MNVWREVQRFILPSLLWFSCLHSSHRVLVCFVSLRFVTKWHVFVMCRIEAPIRLLVATWKCSVGLVFAEGYHVGREMMNDVQKTMWSPKTIFICVSSTDFTALLLFLFLCSLNSLPKHAMNIRESHTEIGKEIGDCAWKFFISWDLKQERDSAAKLPVGLRWYLCYFIKWGFCAEFFFFTLKTQFSDILKKILIYLKNLKLIIINLFWRHEINI